MNKANNNRSINNLIDANVRLFDENKLLKNDNMVLNTRILKARDYINKILREKIETTDKELLKIKNILKGKSENEE